MSNRVVMNGAISRVAARRRSEVNPARRVESLDGTAAEDVRLIIEEPEPGQIVYVLVDRRTGRVLSRRTREDMEKLGEDPNYTGGGVFDIKA